MSAQIVEVVLIPIVAGLFLNRVANKLMKNLQPAMAFLSLTLTTLAIGASEAHLHSHLVSPICLAALGPVLLWHSASFWAGYELPKIVPRLSQNRALYRCMSLECGMQSSLLALLLAQEFFKEQPVVQLVATVSTVAMTLMGFALVAVWQKMDSSGDKVSMQA